MWCMIELRPGQGVPVRYDVQSHSPSMRAGEDDWECTDLVACTSRCRQNEQAEDTPPGPERLIITATDAEGHPLL